MSNANQTFDADGKDHKEQIAEYEDEFAGEDTDVEGVELPPPDSPWFETFTWLIARVDADTIKFGDPSDYADADSDVAVIHEDGEDKTQVTKVDGDGSETILADEEATRLGRNMDIDPEGNSLKISFDGDAGRGDVEFDTGNGLEISVNGSDTNLEVVENGDELSLLYSSDTQSEEELAAVKTEGSDFDSGSDNEASNFPVVPMFDQTQSEIELNEDVPTGGLVFSIPDDQLFISR